VAFERTIGAFLISTDPARFDLDAIHAYLTRSYWSPGVPREILADAIAASLSFGLYDGARQIGFARMVTDRATFAYLADVYVLEEYQGRGLGKALVRAVMEHPDLARVRRFILMTRDAHGLYEQFGWRALAQPERCMEIARRPEDLYGRASDEA
jgi:GNAT superfamily N-acetyltransferase